MKHRFFLVFCFQANLGVELDGVFYPSGIFVDVAYQQMITCLKGDTFQKNIILCIYVKKSGAYVHICLQSHTPVFWFGARLDMKGLTKKALQKSRGNDWRVF